MKIEQLFALDFLLKKNNNDSQIINYGRKYQIILCDNGKFFTADFISINANNTLVNPQVDFEGIVELNSFDKIEFSYYYNVASSYRKNYFTDFYSTSEITKFPALYIDQLIDVVTQIDLPKNFVITNPVVTNVSFLETDLKLDAMLLSENCRFISLQQI